MFKKKRLTVLSMAILLALLVAAVMPFAALADDSTPPPPDTPVVEEPSADAPAVDEPVTDAPAVDEPSADAPTLDEPVADAPAVEEPSADVPVAEEPSVDAPVVDTPVADAPAADVPSADSPAADAPAVDLTVPEILEQLPAETDLVVVDQNSEALPLASVEAANAFVAPDPYYTLGGTTYQFTTINDALSALGSAVPDDGNIYVDAGTYNEDITLHFSGGSLGLVGAGSNDTIINGNVLFETGAGSPTFSGFTVHGELDVFGFGSAVTLNDVLVDDPAAGTSGTIYNASLYVEGRGTADAVLNNVVVSPNNTAYIGSQNHNVTINDSLFSGSVYLKAGTDPTDPMYDPSVPPGNITCSNSVFSSGVNIIAGEGECNSSGGGNGEEATPLPEDERNEGSKIDVVDPATPTEPTTAVSASELPEVTLEALPAPLPETLSDGSSFTFAGGFDAANIEIPEGGSVEITFSLPVDVNPANLTIMMFDGTAWVQLTDFVILPDGTVQLTITFPGEIVFGQKG